MRLSPLSSTLAAAIAALTVLALAAPAQSAPDTTPPVLKTPIKSSWVVGSQVSADSIPDCSSAETGDGIQWVRADQTFTWKTTDPSRPVRFSLVTNTKGEGPDEPIALGTRTTYSTTTTNANQGCGGGSWMTSNWDLTARDSAGNEVTNNVEGGLFTLTQDSNRVDDSFYAPQAIIAYGGSWAQASCACWSDGGVHKTSAKNASATITLGTPPRPTSVTHVGLVMHKGPGRGKLQVFLNGVLVKTVDLLAATNQPRMIVWQAAVALTSSIRIVNLATSGRPRIDLDAVLTN